MKHGLLLLAAVTPFIASATAASVSFNQSTQTVQPGQNTTLGHMTVTGDNTTTVESVSHNFPFTASWSNRSRTTANNTTTITGAVELSVPADESPIVRHNSLFVTVPGETLQQPVEYEIAAVQNWTVDRQRIERNISVGSNGVFGNVTVTERGNDGETGDITVTGNLSQFVRAEQDTFETHPNAPDTVILSYGVNRETPFGYYSGTLHLSTATRNRSVNLSSRFQDDIRPEFVSVTVPDAVMATTPADWTVTVRENLDVDQVTANITRQTTVQDGNDTVTVNRSAGTVTFDHVSNTERWTATFDNTAARGQYFVELAARDESGNTATVHRSFQVESLDALTVLEDDFEFDSDRPDATLTQPVLRLKHATPVNVTLDSLTVVDGNASVVVGLQHEDASSADTFDDGPGDVIQIEQAGRYSLVVESDAKTRFRGGTLVYDPIAQHVPVPNTRFSGQFIDPDCPKEQEYAIGQFEGQYTYTEGGCVNGRTKLILEGPGSLCRGFSDPDKCIPGYDLGEIDRIKQQINTTKRSEQEAWKTASRWQLGGGSAITLSALITLLLYLSRRAEGTMAARYAPKKSSIDIFDGGEL